MLGVLQFERTGCTSSVTLTFPVEHHCESPDVGGAGDFEVR